MSMKKISVMIVDDEKLVLEDLKTLVDWEAQRLLTGNRLLKNSKPFCRRLFLLM